MKTDTKSVLHALGVGVLILAVLPFLVFGVPQLVGASQSYVVLSDSMQPAIHAGDVILVGGVNPSNIEEGDVITFTTGPQGTTTHRVVNVTEQSGELRFQTKGDANEDPDRSLVAPRQIVGQVVFTIPKLGYVIQYINTDIGLFGMVLLPGLLFVINEVYVRIGRHPKSDPQSEGVDK